MKKSVLIFTLFFLTQSLFAQTFDAGFLDGRIMFQLKGDIYPNQNQARQTDPNDYSLVEELSQYPELATLLEGVEISKIERPSYYTFKPSLMNSWLIPIERASADAARALDTLCGTEGEISASSATS